ncbi:MAG: hypothetical protein RLZZ398_683 [Verrucomicrobiota bacterium]|jgi:hypothetical protein
MHKGESNRITGTDDKKMNRQDAKTRRAPRKLDMGI